MGRKRGAHREPSPEKCIVAVRGQRGPLKTTDPEGYTMVEKNQAKAKAELSKLQGQIKKTHHLCISTYRKGLEHAREAGKLLNKAMEACQVAGLSFSNWVPEHCGMTRQHANNYRRIADNWAKIEAAGDRIDTVTGALALLRDKPGRQPSKSPGKVRVPKSAWLTECQKLALDPDKVKALLIALGVNVNLEEAQQQPAA